MASLKYALRELVEMAVQIEIGGERYYRYAADKNESVQNIFLLLADDERRHATLFQSLISPNSDYEQSGIDKTESIPYLRAIVDSTVLRYLLDRTEYPEKVTRVTEALDFAVGFEKESLLFYYQLLERIMVEEKKHIERIMQLYNPSSSKS